MVEHGTHGELMRASGLYSELFALQAAAYVESHPAFGDGQGSGAQDAGTKNEVDEDTQRSDIVDAQPGAPF